MSQLSKYTKEALEEYILSHVRFAADKHGCIRELNRITKHQAFNKNRLKIESLLFQLEQLKGNKAKLLLTHEKIDVLLKKQYKLNGLDL